MGMATGDNQFILGKNDFRNAAVFVGGASDDGVQIDAFAAARVAANDVAGTFTAWINVQDITGTYAILGCGDENAVDYIYLAIAAGKIQAKAARAGPNVAWDLISTAIAVQAHKWHHIALVQNATKPVIYVDGVLVALTETDVTEATFWFDTIAGIDGGHIGCADSVAGTAALTLEFKGAISDVKYWAVALTALQVENDYLNHAPANITGTTTNLISWWDMKDDYVDSVAGHDGTEVGDAFLSNGYSEIASRAKVAGVVVADDVHVVQVGLETIGLFTVKA